MNFVSEQTDKGYLIKFNPEIDPTLREYSEKSLQKSSESMKFTGLKLWASYKLRNDEKYKQYEKYEDNPSFALKEVKDIQTRLGKSKKPEFLQSQYSEGESFYLFNSSIPTDVCSVVIRDYFDKITKKERDLCLSIIIKTATESSGDSYHYQASDGIQAAISVLPIILEKYPNKNKTIKKILILNLFNYYPIDMAGTGFNAFSVIAIQKLWSISFDDAQSILLGFLLLKPKFDLLREKIRQKNYKKNKYGEQDNDIIKKLIKENQTTLNRVFNNQLSINDIIDIEKIDLYTLKTAFQLIPLKTGCEGHKIMVKKIISIFAEKIISNDREDRVDYTVRHEFLERLAYFILSSPKNEILDYLKPLVDKFNSSEAVADLFKELISAEDYLDYYENFWEVWNIFKEKIINICEKGDEYWYVGKIVKSYLFAQNPWKESVVEWHTFKNENKAFFKEIAEKLGHCPSALYAISKLLNDIGSPYLDDGIAWISGMLKKNDNLSDAKLEVNTIYYLENLVKKYVYKNREVIKKHIKLKQNVLTILDFLVNKGSVIGYLLRENIM